MTIETSRSNAVRNRRFLAAATLAAGVSFSAEAWADLSIEITKSGNGSIKVELVLASGETVKAEVPTKSTESEATIAKNLAGEINKKKPGTATEPTGAAFTVASDEVELDVGKGE